MCWQARPAPCVRWTGIPLDAFAVAADASRCAVDLLSNRLSVLFRALRDQKGTCLRSERDAAHHQLQHLQAPQEDWGAQVCLKLHAFAHSVSRARHAVR
jgi:hypothetical protein